ILGAGIMKQLREKAEGDLRFSGIGGELMAAEGLSSLFPMETLSVMGVWEVLPRIPDLLARIKQTVRDIEEKQPDILVTIDSPDFCFRVAKSVKQRGKAKMPIVHDVAPSVWAWRPGRAKKVAQFLDHLLALLPFEPPYFEKEGLACTFTGHPVMENEALIEADGARFRAENGIAANEALLCVLPGSRHSELTRMLPVFRQTLETLKANHKGLRFVTVTFPHLHDVIAKAFDGLNVMITTTDKYDAFAAADAALATSGTVALELAAVGTPSVIGYRMSALNGFLAKLLVKAKYASLPNIILDAPVLPELLLENCTVDNLTREVGKLLTDDAAATTQRKAFTEMRQKFEGLSPSATAADVILSLM
ncbi:MAG: lipid-A-disaccharide synthase, partial [Alphaproteobacteria bacterium]